jgi:hypothetical protein
VRRLLIAAAQADDNVTAIVIDAWQPTVTCKMSSHLSRLCLTRRVSPEEATSAVGRCATKGA